MPGRRTVLFDQLRRAGAEFTEWEGSLWADHFGDPRREHEAVRQGAGVWDLSPLRKWELSGAGALAAADHIFTHDIAGLERGQLRYSPFCDADGHMIGDATVFNVAEGLLWVFTARDDGEHLRRAASGFEVAVRPMTDELACLQVQGPGARDLLRGFVPDIDRLRYFRFWPEPVRLAGVSCRVARIGYSGEPGYELFCAAGEAEALWDAVVTAKAVPYGFAATETLRIEAGLILIGREYLPYRSTPYDVSLDRLVRLDKDRFIGKETLAAVAASPPRRLVTIAAEAAAPVPPAGTRIIREGETVGSVTSSCRSPTFGTVVALGVVARAVAEDGSRVDLDMSGKQLRGVMRLDPVYDPSRTRTRS